VHVLPQFVNISVKFLSQKYNSFQYIYLQNITANLSVILSPEQCVQDKGRNKKALLENWNYKERINKN
jgi:hypothetical protein